MANTRAGNVIRIDTNSSTLADATNICAIKFIPGAADATASLKKESTSGNIIWSHVSGDGDPSPLEPVFEEVEIRCNGGVFANISSGSILYLYLKA